MDVDETVVVFATPKVAEPVRRLIEDHLEELEALLSHRDVLASPPKFRIIANQDFNDEVLRPVIEQVGTVADTSELFMRAEQLLDLCDAVPRAHPRIAAPPR